ncbi:MAG: thioredoxin family protein [Magnetococcales bacterium]|nr:thioredoxin family protein [Magnetococcales bacterium]
MKEVKVLGAGCKNCETTAHIISSRAEKMGVAIHIEKVSDMAEILGFGVMSTPGIVVDGQVVHTGGIPSFDDVDEWLAE